MQKRIAILTLLLAGSACGDRMPTEQPVPVIEFEDENNVTEPDPEPEPEPGEVLYLSPTEHLSRASIALRGKRPSLADLRAVADNPDALEPIIDRYLDSEDFATTIRNLHNEDLLLRAVFFNFAPRGPFSELELVEFNDSIHEQPLRLIEHVVMNDRPYSEIVTADYTVANEVAAGVWGLDYQGDGEEWVETRWPEEGRPHAGLLSESMIYLRHYSTPLNAQRSRANMFSNALLCYDFLDRPVNVDGNVDLSDPAAVNDAVQTNPSCASCHQTLDPLANMFWSYEYFIFPQGIQEYPTSNYRPEYDTQHRPVFTNRPKGYFGFETNDVRDLGQQIAADPRFATCTVKRFASYMMQLPREELGPHEIADLHTEFVSTGMNARQLARSIVLSDAFRTSHATKDDVADEAIGVLKLRPRQLTRYASDLTGGMSWGMNLPFALFADQGVDANYGDTNLAEDALFGYEVLAGGIDDFVVTEPQHTINATSILVFERLAHEMAGFVVEQDFAPVDVSDPANLRPAALLTRVTAETTDEAELRAQMADLHLRLLGLVVTTDSPEIDETFALWTAAHDISNDTERAWKTVLTGLFQDPRFIYY